MKEHINSCHKESERRAAYLEQNTAHFYNIVNIGVNFVSVIPQQKKR